MGFAKGCGKDDIEFGVRHIGELSLVFEIKTVADEDSGDGGTIVTEGSLGACWTTAGPAVKLCDVVWFASASDERLKLKSH